MPSEPDKPKRAGSPTWLLGTASVILAAALGLVLLNGLRNAQRRNEARIEQLEQEVAEARDQLRATGKVLVDLWKQVDGAPAGSANAPEAAVSVVPELDAERKEGIVTHSDNRHRVYVVSLGSVHGIGLGQRIRILRGDEYVTDILIDSVQPTASAGTIPADRPKKEIREKDRAIPLR